MAVKILAEAKKGKSSKTKAYEANMVFSSLKHSGRALEEQAQPLIAPAVAGGEGTR